MSDKAGKVSREDTIDCPFTSASDSHMCTHLPKHICARILSQKNFELSYTVLNVHLCFEI